MEDTIEYRELVRDLATTSAKVLEQLEGINRNSEATRSLLNMVDRSLNNVITKYEAFSRLLIVDLSVGIGTVIILLGILIKI